MNDFATTQWTLVWEAAQENPQHGRPALSELVQRYWPPLYAFARRRGMSAHDAEDATQEFLAQIINGKMLAGADPAKGRFRAFLLTAWKHFLIDQHRREQTIRRGGENQLISVDVQSGEYSWLEFISQDLDPDQAFLRTWAENLLKEAEFRLREVYRKRDQSRILERLLPHLTKPLQANDYLRLSHELSCSSNAVKVALHRLRQRFGQTVREVVSETVDSEREVDSELNDLLSVLRLNASH